QFLEAAAEFDAAYRAQAFSACLCNAALAYQAALDFPNAILRYRAFLAVEPNPPGRDRIKADLASLEARVARMASDGGVEDDAGAGQAPVVVTPPPEASRAFRSQIIVVSDPSD